MKFWNDYLKNKRLIKYDIWLLLVLITGCSLYGKSPKEKEDGTVVKMSVVSVKFYYRKNVDEQPFAYIEKDKNYTVSWPDLYVSEYEFYDDNVDVIEMGVAKKFGRSSSPNFRKRILYADRPLANPSIFHDDNRLKVMYYYPEIFVPYNSPKESAQGHRNYYTSITKHKDLRFLPALYFHENNEVSRKRIRIEVPNWLELDVLEMNLEEYEVEREIYEKSNKTIYVYTISNLEASKKEKFSSSWSNSKPHLLMLPKSTSAKKGSYVYFRNTKDLYAWYYGLISNLDNKLDVLKPLVKELITGKKTDIEKVNAIYYWVQDNIRYLAFEDGIAGFRPEEVQNVYNNKFGDCKGMANLLTEMLKIAGYDAHISWLGTRGKKEVYDYSIPSLIVDNHMITSLFLNDSIYYLDPTEKFGAFGEYAYRIQGRPVLIEQGVDYKIERVPDFQMLNPSYRTKFRLVIDLNRLEVSGAGTVQLRGEEKMQFLRRYNEVSQNDQSDFLYQYFDLSPSIDEDNLKLSRVEDRSLPIDVSLDIKTKHELIPSIEGYYLMLDYSNRIEKLEDDRTEPVYYGEKVYLDETYEFEIPNGYEFVNIPKDIIIENEAFVFKQTFVNEKDVLLFQCTIKIHDGQIEGPYVQDWINALKRGEENKKSGVEIKKM